MSGFEESAFGGGVTVDILSAARLAVQRAFEAITKLTALGQSTKANLSITTRNPHLRCR